MPELHNLFGYAEITRLNEVLAQMKDGVQTVGNDMSGIFFRVWGVADLKHRPERQEMGEVGAFDIV
jgi:hypothetical protein